MPVNVSWKAKGEFYADIICNCDSMCSSCRVLVRTLEFFGKACCWPGSSLYSFFTFLNTGYAYVPVKKTTRLFSLLGSGEAAPDFSSSQNPPYC